MLLVEVPFAGRIWAFPVLTALTPSKAWSERHGRRHRSTTEWARLMLLTLRRWLPDRTIVAVDDGDFAVLELLHALGSSMVIITRRRKDARLSDPPPCHDDKLGLAPRKGKRQPRLAERLTDPATRWRRLVQASRATWRSAGWIECTHGTALWHHGGKPIVPAVGRSRMTTLRIVERVMQRAGITGPDGRPLVQAHCIRTAAVRLADACFVVIAGLVGMRVSEILSMQVGAVEHHPIGETGVAQAYIVARLFKMAEKPEERVKRWLAPAPVVRAVECLERLYAPLRATSGYNEMFLAKVRRPNKVTGLTTFGTTERLNAFALHVGVPRHEGRLWRFSPHQFRKTFARFVARGDRSHLLALATHFKHVSVAMTSRGYVGDDFALHELVDREGQIETALALDHLLASDRLGGRMGERIVARNHVLRGRADEQVRRDYIDFVLAETGLRIRRCDHVLRSIEEGRDGGAGKPDAPTPGNEAG